MRGSLTMRFGNIGAGMLGLLLGLGLASCGDEDTDDGAPLSCAEQVDACGDCGAGLFCDESGASGPQCYLPCDTAEDCSDCGAETLCGIVGERQQCVEPN